MDSLLDKEEMTPADVKKIANKAIYFGFGAIVLIVLSMTTCTMHSNTYDPERLREEAEMKKVEVEIERAKIDIHRAELTKEQAELKTLERLVKLGVNPIAARCGVYGWQSDRNGNDDTACIIAAGKDSTITTEKTIE